MNVNITQNFQWTFSLCMLQDKAKKINEEKNVSIV